MRKWIAMTVALLTIVPVLGAEFEMGLGFGVDYSTEKSTLSALEVFGASQPDGWLTLRFSLCYLPPLLPGEGAAFFTGLGAMGNLGDQFRLIVGLGGGIVWEAGLIGPVLNPAASATLGLEFWFGDRFGLYVSGSFIACWRQTPYGRVVYPYLPWSLGVLFATPSVRVNVPAPEE